MGLETFFDAIAILLILEGLLPFISPSQWKNFMALMSEQRDSLIRWLGLISMVLGVILIYIVRFFVDD